MSRRSRVALALGAFALAASWLFGSHPLAPVGVGLLAAGLAAAGWARLVRPQVSLERRPYRLRHVEGDDVRIEYRVPRRTRLPLGSVRVRETIGRLGARETRLRRGRTDVVLPALPRGRYAVTDAVVVLEDPLGLEQVVLPVTGGDPILVEPRLVSLGPLFSESGRRPGDGRRQLLHRPSGFDFHSVREHERGESLRAVHWPTTARRGRLMVKELLESPRDELVVLLDCDPAALAGPPGASSFDAQARAAGSLLQAHVARGRRSALVLGRRGAPVVRVSSLEGLPEALVALAAAEPDGRTLAESLADAHGPAARTGELVVVTARLEARAVSRLLAGAGRRTAVVYVDAPSFATGRHTPATPELLRLTAAGVPVAVVRRGDDLRAVLEGASPGRAHATA